MLQEIELMALAVASMFLYFPLNRGHAKWYWESPADHYIPYVSYFIIPYLAFFPLILISLLLMFTEPRDVEFCIALIVGVLGGSFIRFFMHTGIRQTMPRKSDIFDALVRWLYRHDDRARTFPSSHVLISTICVYYLIVTYPTHAFLTLAIGLLVGFSTLFVKQHYVVDIVGGLAVAAAAIVLAGIIVV